MRFLATPHAERQLAERQDWWRAQRDKAPDLFERELADLVDRIRLAPESFPVFVERQGHVVRRALMPKTHCHLYFETRSSVSELWLIAVGGSQRRRAPRLRFQEGL